MKWEQLSTILSTIGVDASLLSPRNGRVMIPCPLASHFHAGGSDEHPSFRIWFNETPVRWKCFTCHEKGRLWELVHSYADLNDRQDLRDLATRLVNEDKVSLLQEVESRVSGIGDKWLYERTPIPVLAPDAMDRFPPVWESERAVRYLRTRLHARATIEKFDLRYDNDKDRVLFPVRREDGNLVGAVGRICIKELAEGVLPYLNYFGFAGVSCLGGDLQQLHEYKRILVVEGFCDLLHIHAWAYARKAAVVCTWTARLSDQHTRQLIRVGLPVSCWYDNDDAGEKGWAEAREKLWGRVARVTRARLQCGCDPGDLNEGQFDRIYSKTLRSVL